MASALIQFTQGAHTDTAGKAVLGAYGDFSAVTVTNGSNTGVASWKIYLLDAPPDSASYPVGSQPQILAQAADNTPTVAFTPDVAGTYRVMLEVTSASSVVDRDIRCFAIPDGRGFVRPPFQEGPEPLPVALPGIISLDPRPNKPDEQNYGANVRGWAGNGTAAQLDSFLRQYDDLPQKLVSSTPYTQAATDPPLHLVDVPTIGGPATFNLPTSPRAGFVSRLGVLGGFRSPVTIQPGGGGTIGSGSSLKVYGDTGVALVHRGSNNWSPIFTPGDTENVDRANVKVEFGAAGDGATDDTAAINAALACGKANVYFPPGTYAIAGALTGSADEQTITFAPGAKLLVAPATASVTFSGARQTITGISISISATSTRTFSVLTISGARSSVKAARFDIAANIANATLLQLANDDVEARDVLILSNFSFFRGASITKVDDSATLRVIVTGLKLLSSPSAPQALGSLINIHGGDTLVENLQVVSGGITTYSEGVIRIRASNVTLINPQVFCFGAQYGIYGEDSASEKVTIFQGNIQGRNNATYVAGSEGYRVGHQSGHQKLFGTYINGWENGVVFHGSADTPGFNGAVIANNDHYAFVIDAGTGIGAVRGLTIIDCYLSDVTQDSFMHVITGKLEACYVAGSELGYDTVAILVEDAVLACSMTLSGNFIQGAGGGVLGIAQPNIASDILFIHNTLSGGNTYGYGPYADRAMEILSPTLGTTKVTTSLTVGTNGNPWLRRYYTFFTANYGAGIPANDMVELDFSWADGAVGSYMLTFGVFGTLAANTNLTFTAFVRATGTVTLRARNHSASPIGAISGTVHFEATKNF